MIRYLVAATLLWAFALLVYELCFRRLRLHAENRAYLLLSLALGLLLPLVQLPVPHAAPDPVQTTVRRTMAAQEQLAGAMAAVPSGGPAAVNWLLVVYLAGAGCMAAWLLWQAALLVRMLRGARREVLQGVPVLRTRGAHSPFSFLGRIVIPAGAAYSDGELRMILLHEGAHLRLRHSIDILALQALRVVFWFHPLVHLYYRRLRMVHEFQADAAQRGDAAAYGRFLISQALLGGAPGLAHSFFQSPLKTRIAMLIKTSRATRLRYLAALLLLPVFFLCTAFLPKLKRVQQGNRIEYNGHVLVKGTAGPADTTVTLNPATGQQSMRIMLIDSVVIMLDNQRIYGVPELEEMPHYRGPGNSLAMQIFNRIRPELGKLPDGDYQLAIDRVIVDEEGRIVYFECHGLRPSFLSILRDADGKETGVSLVNLSRVGTDAKKKPGAKNNSVVSPVLELAVEDLLEEELLNKARYTPAMVGGKAVPSRLDANEFDFLSNRLIVVKDHQATLSIGQRGVPVNH